MAYTVAQAEVTVVPDAKGFGRELRAQITPEANRIGRDLGDRIGQQARARLKASFATMPDAKVGVDTRPAKAQVDRFLGETQAKARVAGERAGQQMGDGIGNGIRGRAVLIGSVVGLALAAGAPILAAGAGVLFGGLAAVIAHNEQAVEDGASRLVEEVGAAYKEIGTNAAPFLVQALDDVRVAAVELAPAVGAIFSDLEPAIDGVVGGVLDLVENAMPGLAAAIAKGQPIFAAFQSALGSIGSGLGGLFDIIANNADIMGDALTGFGDALEAALLLLGEMAVAGAEVGAIVFPALVSVFNTLADVLQVVAPILPQIVLGFIGLRAASALAPMMGTLAARLQTVGANAMVTTAGLLASERAGMAAGRGFAVASAGARGLQAALGPIGWLMLALSFIIPALTSESQEATEASDGLAESQQSLTDALQASRGAIDDNVRMTAALAAEQHNLLTTADQIGVKQSLMVDAILGVPGAYELVIAAMGDYADSGLAAANATEGVSGGFNGLVGVGALAGMAMAKQKEVLDGLVQTTTTQVERQQMLNDVIAGGGDAAELNATRLQAISDAANAASTEVNLLKTALDALRGETVDVNEAQARLTEMVTRARESFEGEEKAATNAAGSFDLHTASGAKAYQSLLQIGEGSNAVIAAMEKQGVATDVVTAKDQSLRVSFIQTAMKMGASKDAARLLADQILGIPSERKTEIDANTETAAQKIQAVTDKLLSIPLFRNVTIRVHETFSTARGGAPIQYGSGLAIGGIIKPYAAGGIEPMQGGIAKIVPPNHLRLIGDRVVDDEAYIPINDSARSLAILSETANRMGYGLAQASASTGRGGKTDARTYQFQINAGAGDAQAIARTVRDVQLDLEYLHG